MAGHGINQILDAADEMRKSGFIRDDEYFTWLTLTGRIRKFAFKNNKPAAPCDSNPVTPNIVLAVKDLHDNLPDLTHKAIAAMFNIKDARVSEILNGKYD